MLNLLFSALFYSLNSFAWKYYLATHNSQQLIWGRAIFTSLIAITYYFIAENHSQGIIHAYHDDGLHFILASSFGLFGLIALTKGLKNSTLSSFAIYTALISILSGIGTAIVESIEIETLLGSSLIFIGYFFSVNWRSNINNIQIQFWFIIMVICFVLSGFLYWPIVEKYPPIYTLLTQEFFVFIALTLYLITHKKFTESILFFLKETKMLLVFSLLIFLAVYFGLKGLKITNPYLLSLTGLSSPILSIIIGASFLKEKFTWKLAISLILFFVGSTVLYAQYD